MLRPFDATLMLAAAAMFTGCRRDIFIFAACYAGAFIAFTLPPAGIRVWRHARHATCHAAKCLFTLIRLFSLPYFRYATPPCHDVFFMPLR